jgi:LysM repeat protein
LSERQLPAIGEKLYLQNLAPESSLVVSVNADNIKIEEVVTESVDEEYEVYVVQPKETLYSISKRFNVSVQELQQWNNLSSSDLKEGMELIVSQKDYNAFKGTR